MNKILQINKKLIVIIFFILLTAIVFSIILKQNANNNNLLIDSTVNLTYDIIDPRFIINNDKQKIAVSANEGNFIDENKVLLKNNVTFKSKKFQIKSSEVFFDKYQETAFSEKNSEFKSNKTTINSKGFEIKDKGNTLYFNGKTKITLKK